MIEDDIRRRSVDQNVQLFIRSNNDILNTAVFKYYLHKVRNDTTLKIPINLSMTFNYYTQLPQN